MRNLKAALILFGAIHIAQGIVLIVAPDKIADLSGSGQLADYVPYIFATLGAAFIAAGVWFITTGLDPLQNITGVKLAILWSALLLIIQLYSVIQNYVDFGQVWLGVVEMVIFAGAFLIFYPYRQR
jgi:hypothetical protein